MTKKDFILIARILRETQASPHIVEAFARELQLANPNFKQATFVKAAQHESAQQERADNFAAITCAAGEIEKSERGVIRDALQDAIETIEWMRGCTGPAEDEIDSALSRLKQALSPSR